MPNTLLAMPILAQLLAERNREAFRLVYDRFAPYIYGIITRSTMDELTANERLQEVFAEVWQQADTCREGSCSLTFWIMRITRQVLSRYPCAQDMPCTSVLFLLACGYSRQAAADKLGMDVEQVGQRLRQELADFKPQNE